VPFLSSPESVVDRFTGWLALLHDPFCFFQACRAREQIQPRDKQANKRDFQHPVADYSCHNE
jgi:hypothetical protein